MNTHNRLRDEAGRMLQAGLSVLPAHADEKFAAVRWKPFQSRLPTTSEVQAWFRNGHDALCVVAGAVSGHLETIDFDLAGEAWEPWCDLVREAEPGLLERLVIEKTPSGGFHVSYRCEEAVSGNLKLAQRRYVCDGSDAVVIAGKEYVPARDAQGEWSIVLALIETRGNGGLFLCAPSRGYELVQGEFTDLPVLTAEERESLLQAAWSLNEHVPEPVRAPVSSTDEQLRPGDDFNQRGDVREVLIKHGWTLARRGENEYWRRPGKTRGWSASLKDSVFFVHSSSAAPFVARTAYAAFAVYTMLEHSGDWSAAGSALRAEGYGGDEVVATDVDLSGIVTPVPEAEEGPTDPGPVPEELLRIPGFVSEVMDHCLETAPYPNPVLAFCGALSLQAFLAGRKVRDPGDNRTNLYLLGLAHSASGKDHPRKLNTRILHRIGRSECLGDRFASGEGIQDALFLQPCMLFQTDEIDGMLQSINKSRDARHETMMGTLLTLYSSANSVFPMRRKAGKEAAGVIDQPCLSVFGTAIPNHYYEALSERMLTNGFFARMLILESGPRGNGQEPAIASLPERVLETATWWTQLKTREGNLESLSPDPLIVEHTDQAREVFIEARLETEREYAQAEERNDSVGTTVWGRVSEQSRKLALLYAISANHTEPVIGAEAALWGLKVAMHQTRRMLFQAAEHVADSTFDADCLKTIKRLRAAPGHELPHSTLLKRMKLDARSFQTLITTLSQRGDIEVLEEATGGRPGVHYRLRGSAKEGERRGSMAPQQGERRGTKVKEGETVNL